jgi:dihydrofolate synthase / folylpolyglutamate synthase
MNVTAIKTQIIKAGALDIFSFLDANLETLEDNTILAVTSKVVSLCEGHVLPLSLERETLIQEYSDYYLPKEYRKQGTCTITHHAFIGGAGIDESNADGHYVLLPKDSQASAWAIHSYLQKRFGHANIGVIITDSHSTPMRRGASGVILAYAGFHGLKDYRGTPDLFGRKLVMEQANIADALATAAVLVMGEGDEQTPLATMTDLPLGIVFSATAPSSEERAEFFVDLEYDIFSPIFDMTKLTKGKARKAS